MNRYGWTTVNATDCSWDNSRGMFLRTVLWIWLISSICSLKVKFFPSFQQISLQQFEQPLPFPSPTWTICTPVIPTGVKSITLLITLEIMFHRASAGTGSGNKLHNRTIFSSECIIPSYLTIWWDKLIHKGCLCCKVTIMSANNRAETSVYELLSFLNRCLKDPEHSLHG